ncbi:hypothetical protein B0H13DRAFT_1880468 [Mycena leptocephala]|nr:hypothetical protein B0H13DRAFT_1880468 [Mycena leptocephala]
MGRDLLYCVFQWFWETTVTAFRGRGDRGFVSVRTHTSAQADTNLGFRHVDKIFPLQAHRSTFSPPCLHYKPKLVQSGPLETPWTSRHSRVPSPAAMRRGRGWYCGQQPALCVLPCLLARRQAGRDDGSYRIGGDDFSDPNVLALRAGGQLVARILSVGRQRMGRGVRRYAEGHQAVQPSSRQGLPRRLGTRPSTDTRSVSAAWERTQTGGIQFGKCVSNVLITVYVRGRLGIQDLWDRRKDIIIRNEKVVDYLVIFPKFLSILKRSDVAVDLLLHRTSLRIGEMGLTEGIPGFDMTVTGLGLLTGRTRTCAFTEHYYGDCTVHAQRADPTSGVTNSISPNASHSVRILSVDIAKAVSSENVLGLRCFVMMDNKGAVEGAPTTQIGFRGHK